MRVNLFRSAVLFVLFLLIALPSSATAYFLATAAGGGNDANNGLSVGAPWLTPNHAVNCGDVITAASDTTYVFTNFAHNWGTVTCAGGNDVAWLKCAMFDTCKISVNGGSLDNGMLIQTSYWGVQGWEITTTTASSACFIVYPYNNTPVHHVIVANSICNVAGQSGFTIAPRPPNVEDYVFFIGDIAYNTTGGSTNCTSGFNMGSQNPLDTLAGTHIYVGGSFAWNNVDGNPCNGTTPTDGQGFMVDTEVANTAQIVYDNNISVFNGGRGVEVFSSPQAHIYFRHNTTYGNNTDVNQPNHGPCGEIEVNTVSDTEVFLNLAQQFFNVGCGGATNYAYFVTSGDTTDHVYLSYGYSAAGNNTGVANNGGGFAFGPNNVLGTNPSFANPVDPPAPSCGSFASVPACMATVIANFTPTNAAAAAYGYQQVSTTSRYDPLYPQFLCTVTNLPTGLVTPGCLAADSAGTGVTLNSGTTLH
jgi:hypothetical protein